MYKIWIKNNACVSKLTNTYEGLHQYVFPSFVNTLGNTQPTPKHLVVGNLLYHVVVQFQEQVGSTLIECWGDSVGNLSRVEHGAPIDLSIFILYFFKLWIVDIVNYLLLVVVIATRRYYHIGDGSYVGLLCYIDVFVWSHAELVQWFYYQQCLHIWDFKLIRTCYLFLCAYLWYYLFFLLFYLLTI